MQGYNFNTNKKHDYKRVSSVFNNVIQQLEQLNTETIKCYTTAAAVKYRNDHQCKRREKHVE